MSITKRNLPITYSVYIKSHCEAPDFEMTITDSELKKENWTCQINYADDVDEEGHAIGGKCGGNLIEGFDGRLTCKSCGQVYEIDNGFGDYQEVN